MTTQNNPKVTPDFEEMYVINDENPQKLVEARVQTEDVDVEEARKELTLTSYYHAWSDTPADRIRDLLRDSAELQGEIETEEDMTLDDMLYVFIEKEEHVKIEKLKETIEEYNNEVTKANKFFECQKIVEDNTKPVMDILNDNDHQIS